MGEKISKTPMTRSRWQANSGAKTIVTMSGLPAGAPGDKTPNWVVATAVVPPDYPYLEETVRYQWEDGLFRGGKNLRKHADAKRRENRDWKNFRAAWWIMSVIPYPKLREAV